MSNKCYVSKNFTYEKLLLFYLLALIALEKYDFKVYKLSDCVV